MSHLTLAMVEEFFAREEENARGVLRKVMDSAMDTIFKQMKRKLMQLVETPILDEVESGPGPDDTAHGLDHFAGPIDHGQLSTDTNHIPSVITNSHVQFCDLNASNQSQQGGSGDGDSSSNQIASTSSNSRAPDNSNSTEDDQIPVKNKLGVSVNIIPPNEPIPPSSTQSPPSNEQFNDNLFDKFDDDGEDCDCSVCMDEYVDISQLAVDLEQSDHSVSRPTKRARLENDQEQGAMLESSDNAPHVPSTSTGRKRQSSSPSRSVNNKPHKTVTTHGSNKYQCKSPGCSKSFRTDYELSRHERVHLDIKPFSCTWPGCRYSAVRKDKLVVHVRSKHFKLPRLLKDQTRLNIVDTRNPDDYVQVDNQMLQRRLE